MENVFLSPQTHMFSDICICILSHTHIHKLTQESLVSKLTFWLKDCGFIYWRETIKSLEVQALGNLAVGYIFHLKNLPLGRLGGLVG